MKIKNYLLTVLFPIFMIFAFSPIALAQNAEAEAETEIETKAKTADITCEEKSGDAEEKSEKDLATINKAVKNENTAPITSEKNSDAEKTEKSEEKSEKTTQKSDNTAVKSEGVQTAGEVSGETAEPEQKSSSYTVEFTHKDLQYVLPGGTSVKLSKILDKLEIKGDEITKVECSDNSLFSATKESGEWVVSSHKAFHTDEHLYVTIDNTKYNIKVTDATVPSGWTQSGNTLVSNSLGGTNIRATYYTNTQTLVISGSGAVTDVSEGNSLISKLLDNYKNSTGYHVKHIEIGEGITYLGKNMFFGVGRTSGSSSAAEEISLHLPTVLEDIGQYAFERSGVTAAYIPDGVVGIGKGAFRNCPNLRNILIPDTVSSIDTEAFNGTPNGCNIYVGDYRGDLNAVCSNAVNKRFDNYSYQYFHWHGQKIGDTMYAFPKTASEPTGHAGNYSKQASDTDRIQLEIVGYGAMYDYSYKNYQAPWSGYRINFKNITFNTVFGDKKIDSYDRNFTSIGAYAFYNCTSVTSVTLPADLSSSSSNGYRLTSIGTGAFEGCANLTSIRPSGTSVNTFPSGVTALNESVLRGCTKLASFTIPTSVTSIGTAAFKGDTSLSSVTIPASVTVIGNEAFYGVTNINSILEIPVNVTSIGTSAFQGCSGVRNLYIYSTKLADGGMGQNAFEGLASKAFINYVNTGYVLAQKCATGEITYVFGSNNPIKRSNSNSYYYYLNCGDNLRYFIDSVGASQITITGFGPMWNFDANTAPFKNDCSGITKMVMDSGTTIGNYAFYNCVTIATVYLPNTLTTIGTSAFQGCTSLTNVTLPPKASTALTSIGTYAFQGCTSLATIRPSDESSVNTFPAGVTTIGQSAFHGDSALTGITIPTNVTTIGTSAFENCTGLTYINFTSGRNSDLSIGSRAFRSTDSSEETSVSAGTLTIPARVTIGKDAFSHSDYRFTTVDLSAMNRSIGDTAFWGDSGIQNVYLSSNIPSFGGRLFTDATTIWYKYGTKADLMSKMHNDLDTTATPPPSELTLSGWSFPNSNHIFHFLKSGGESTDKCGENLYWRVEYDYDNNDDNDINDTTMYVTGYGNFFTTYGSKDRPWTNNVDGENTITKAVITKTNASEADITNIGDAIFRKLYALKTVEMPNTITNIKHDAFWQCKALANITLPSSLEIIGPGAFNGCAFTSISIPASVTEISDPTDTEQSGWGGFAGCTNLTSVTFEGTPSIGTIGVGAFYNCTSLTSINIPASVITIGNSAFQGDSALTTVTLPPKASITLTSIGTSAFQGCTSLATIRPSDESSGNTFPAGITTIAENAFQNDSALTEITIPSTVTTIGTSAFQGCSGITSLTIPTTIISLGLKDNAFNGLADRADIYYNGTEADFISKCTTSVETVFGHDIESKAENSYVYHFPCGNSLWYGVDGCYDKITITGSGAMYNYSMNNSPFTAHYTSGKTFKTIDMREGTSIGTYAFLDCATLETVTVPSSGLTVVGNNAFDSCTSLTSIKPANATTSDPNTLPATISNNILPEALFFRCSSLTSFTIPSNITTIDDYAFRETGLTSVTIPSNVTTINSQAFYGDTSLTTVTLPPKASTTLTSIGESAFQSCTSLATIRPSDESSVNTFPAGITTITANAFQNDSALTEITIPSSVTTIGNGAFQGCSALATVNFEGNTTATPYSNNITSIGQNAFAGLTTNANIWYKYGNKASLISKCYGGTTLESSFGTGNTYIYHFIKSEGQCGPTLYWKIAYEYPNEASQGIDSTSPETQTMYVTGLGNFYTNYVSNNRPWINNKNASGTTAAGEDNEITKVVIDSGAIDVGAHVFHNLHALQSVTIPNTVSIINEYAFYICKNLNGVTLPNSLTEIKYCAFRDCIGLTSINIPKSLTSITGTTDNNISMGAFSCCIGLANITFESGRTQNLVLGAGAFYNTRATSITLPETLTVIGPGAFQKNTSLTTINIPSTVTTIDGQAFYLDEALTSITIPATVTTMNTNAFSGLANEADIYYDGTEADFTTKCTTSVVNVFGSANPIERSTENSYYYHFKCGDNLYYSLDGINKKTEITGTGPMWNYNKTDNISPFKTHDSIIKNVDMSTATGTSASKLTVGAYAFYNCETLESIALPENTYYQISASAFEASGIKSITLPSSLSWWSGYNIFRNCTRLETATINISRIFSSSFAGCTALTNLTLSKSITQIESTTFDGCSKLASVTIPTLIGTGKIGGNNFRNIGSDPSISQVDIYYDGKQAELESKCSGGNIATSFGFAVVNDGKYAFHFKQDITYISNGSTVTGLTPADYETNSGTTLPLPTPPDSANPDTQTYRFDGWCTDAELTTTPITQMTPAKSGPYGDLIYYAKWMLTVRTITYTLNGGTFGGNTPVTEFTPESGDTINLSIPTKTDYAFLGWHFEQDLSDDAIGSFVADSSHTQDVTVYADWYERENVSYWANSSQTLQSTTEYEIIKPWETTLQGGTEQEPKWYVLNSDVTFDKRLIVNGHVNLILQDGCNLVVNNGISVNDPNSITIYAQDSDYNYINQDLGNITRMNLVEIFEVYDSGTTTYGSADSSEGPIFELSTGKRYEKNTSAQGAAYRTEDETATIIVGADEWIEESPDVRYYTPDKGITKYYEYEDEDENSYIATSDQGGATRYYYYPNYVTAWDNTNAPNDRAWTLDEDWHNGDGSYFDTIGSKLYYWDHDEKGEFYYEVTDNQRTHKYYELENSHKYFTDDIDTYNDAKIAGKIITGSGNTSGAGIGGDAQHINGNITIYGGDFYIYGLNNNAGIGTGAFESGSNVNNSNITINGGTFDIKIYEESDEISGGSPIGGGSHANGGSIVINGGRLTLESGTNSNSIGAGYEVTTNTTQISLSWTNITDYITIKKNNINYSTLTIDSNKPFVFVGEDIITNKSYATAETITGKKNNEFTIIPYPNTSYVLTIPNTTTLPFKTTKYKFKSDSSDDTKPSVSVYTRPDDKTTPTIDESTPLVNPYQIALNIDKTNFVKDDGDATIEYDLVDKEQGGTSLVGENKYEYFSSDSYDYDNYRETHIGGAQDVWMSINSNVWENLSPGIYRAKVTFNVGLATNGASSGSIIIEPVHIDPDNPY